MTQKDDLGTFVWVLRKHNMLAKVNSQGILLESEIIDGCSCLSYGLDKKLWISSENTDTAGCQLRFSSDDFQWNAINLSDIKTDKISSDHAGGCFVLSPQGAIYHVDKSENVQLIFPNDTAHDFSVNAIGVMWLISRQKKASGGNMVFWCMTDMFNVQPAHGQPVAKKIAAGKEETARILTIGGEVASLNLGTLGGLETPGGVPFANDITSSISTNTIWIVTKEGSGKHKRRVLKFWNPDIDRYMDWHTIPNIEPLLITGGY